MKLAQNKRAERERNPVYFLKGPPTSVGIVLHVCLILNLKNSPKASLLASLLPET